MGSTNQDDRWVPLDPHVSDRAKGKKGVLSRPEGTRIRDQLSSAGNITNWVVHGSCSDKGFGP